MNIEKSLSGKETKKIDRRETGDAGRKEKNGSGFLESISVLRINKFVRKSTE